MTSRWVLASWKTKAMPQVETFAGKNKATTQQASSSKPAIKMEQFILDSQANKNIIYPLQYTIDAKPWRITSTLA